MSNVDNLEDKLTQQINKEVNNIVELQYNWVAGKLAKAMIFPCWDHLDERGDFERGRCGKEAFKEDFVSFPSSSDSSPIKLADDGSVMLRFKSYITASDEETKKFFADVLQDDSVRIEVANSKVTLTLPALEEKLPSQEAVRAHAERIDRLYQARDRAMTINRDAVVITHNALPEFDPVRHAFNEMLSEAQRPYYKTQGYTPSASVSTPAR